MKRKFIRTNVEKPTDFTRPVFRGHFRVKWQSRRAVQQGLREYWYNLTPFTPSPPTAIHAAALWSGSVASTCKIDNDLGVQDAF
ncbi:hypothetical protein PMIN06_007258 [Paraphaeosphaeria minitans]